MKQAIAALLAITAAMGAAQAQSLPATAPHAYVGIGVASADNLMTDDYRSNAKIFGGYEFDRNWAVEAGYSHQSGADFTTWLPDSALTRGSVKGWDSYVAAKYTVPVSGRLSAFGKLGVSHSEREARLPGWGIFTDNDTGVYAGVGLQYALNEKVSLVGEFERYGKDKDLGAKANTWTAGLKYGF